MPIFTRSGCFDKRTDKVLLMARYKLLFFLKRIKEHGEGIVRPQQLSEDIEAVKIDCANDSTYEDFKTLFLESIQEAIVLPHGVVFVLSPGLGLWEYVLVNYDPLEVNELTYSAYSDFRSGNPKASNGVAAVPAAVLHGVAVVPAAVLQTSGIGSITIKRSKLKKIQKQ